MFFFGIPTLEKLMIFMKCDDMVGLYILENLKFDNKGSFGQLAFSIKIVDRWCKALFQCNSSVTLFRILIAYGKTPLDN